VRRPLGQAKGPAEAAPVLTRGLPQSRLRGWSSAFISARPNPLGEAGADERGGARAIFGFCLLNDWSGARHPGPGNISRSGRFLAKNFATTVSPWVVTAGSARALTA